MEKFLTGDFPTYSIGGMASTFPSDALLRPQFKLVVCPFCGMPCEFRYDKKDRPFVHCRHCWSRTFFYTPTGLSGLQMVQDVILRHGAGRWATEIARRVMNFVRRSGGFSVRPTQVPVHRPAPPRLAPPRR